MLVYELLDRRVPYLRELPISGTRSPTSFINRSFMNMKSGTHEVPTHQPTLHGTFAKLRISLDSKRSAGMEVRLCRE